MSGADPQFTKGAMLIWIFFLILSVLAIFSVLFPFLRRTGTVAPRSEYDLTVYKDQLEEIERDLDRNVISAQEADTARTEISRRILGASAQMEVEQSRQGLQISSTVAWLTMALVPVMALFIYLVVGRPDLPDMPLVARYNAPPEQQEMAVLIAQVEDRLRQNPEDGRGWEVLAPVYKRLKQFDKAAAAYRNAIKYLGPSVERWVNLGEALVFANRGTVGVEALSAFERVLELDPDAIKPRIYKAMALGQGGENQSAVAEWNKLLEDAEGTEPWLGLVNRELARLNAVSELEGAETKQPSVSAEDVEAAESLTEGDRRAMILGMVASLEERLNTEGGTVQEWKRLINSLTVLGRMEDAAEAVNRALSEFEGNEDARASIIEFARSAGLPVANNDG